MIQVSENGKSPPFTVEVEEIDKTKADRYLSVGEYEKQHDRLKALGIVDKFPVNATRINGINAALKFILNDFSMIAGNRTNPRSIRINKNAELWAETWEQYGPQIEIYNGIVDSIKDKAVRGCMSKAGVAAVALVTLQAVPGAARFWDRVAHDDGLGANDPAHRLNKWLLINRGKELGSTHIGIVARATSACWNAYFNRREMLVMRVPSKLSIKGTKWE